MKPFAMVLLAAAVSGCVTGNGPPTAGGRQVTYACDRGPHLAVTYAGSVARVDSGSGQVLILQRKKSDSGFWYESTTHRIRGQGNMMTFWPAYTAMKTCHAL